MTRLTEINYSSTPKFQKQFNRLQKKFPTLAEDLETAKINAIELYHVKGIDNQSVSPMSGYCVEGVQVYKLKKFACQALKTKGVRSGIRIIYAYRTAGPRVEFIEIYFKGERPGEDKDRIRQYLATVSD